MRAVIGLLAPLADAPLRPDPGWPILKTRRVAMALGSGPYAPTVGVGGTVGVIFLWCQWVRPIPYSPTAKNHIHVCVRMHARAHMEFVCSVCRAVVVISNLLKRKKKEGKSPYSAPTVSGSSPTVWPCGWAVMAGKVLKTLEINKISGFYDAKSV